MVKAIGTSNPKSTNDIDHSHRIPNTIAKTKPHLWNSPCRSFSLAMFLFATAWRNPQMKSKTIKSNAAITTYQLKLANDSIVKPSYTVKLALDS